MTKKFKSHAHTHHVVIIAMLTLCHSIMSHATLILFPHAFVLTILKSLIPRALWLPQSVILWRLECIIMFLKSQQQRKCPNLRLGETLFI